MSYEGHEPMGSNTPRKDVIFLKKNEGGKHAADLNSTADSRFSLDSSYSDLLGSILIQWDKDDPCVNMV